MTPVEAHLICLSLVAADFLVRAWRIRWIMRGLGPRLRLKEALIINAFGDAANALTPLRLGGEPARLAGMLRCRVRVTAAFVGISLEALISRLVLAVATAWLVWQYAPEWWISAGPSLRAAARDAWPWVVVVLLAGAIIWRYTRQVVSPCSCSLCRVRPHWGP
jgi:hypothetical protein